MKVYKRYEYYGPRGKRWTEWFSIAEVETNEEANEKIKSEKAINASGRNEEYMIS